MQLQHLWLLGGSKLGSSFLNQGLLSEIIITEIPIKLGSGIPLFSDHKLEDLKVQTKRIKKKEGYRQIEITL